MNQLSSTRKLEWESQQNRAEEEAFRKHNREECFQKGGKKKIKLKERSCFAAY